MENLILLENSRWYSRSSRYTRSEFLTPPLRLVHSGILSLISLLVPPVYRIFVSRANRVNYIPRKSGKHFTSVQLYYYFSLHGWLVILSFFHSFIQFPDEKYLSIIRIIIPLFIFFPSIPLFRSDSNIRLTVIWSRSAARIYFIIVILIRHVFQCSFYNIHGFPPLQGLSERLK